MLVEFLINTGFIILISLLIQTPVFIIVAKHFIPSKFLNYLIISGSFIITQVISYLILSLLQFHFADFIIDNWLFSINLNQVINMIFQIMVNLGLCAILTYFLNHKLFCIKGINKFFLSYLLILIILVLLPVIVYLFNEF